MTTLKMRNEITRIGTCSLANPGVIATTLLRATTVFGRQAASVALLIWTINSFVIFIACFATHRLAHIVEHSGHMGSKVELWFQILVADEAILCDTVFVVVGVDNVVVLDQKNQQHKGETLLHFFLVLFFFLFSFFCGNCFVTDKEKTMVFGSEWRPLLVCFVQLGYTK